ARDLPAFPTRRSSDLGQLGSCTANALAGAVEFLEKEDGAHFVDLSRLFIYYNERVIEGTVDQDSGAFIRDGIKSLAKQGVCPEQIGRASCRERVKISV